MSGTRGLISQALGLDGYEAVLCAGGYWSVLALALGVHSCAAVPRPSDSSLMPLRRALPKHQSCV